MKNSIKLFSVLIAFVCSVGVYAQTEKVVEPDVIHKVDQTTIECRVTEMNTTEVKYHYLDRPGITLAIDIELVDYIILNTGEKIVPENTDQEMADLAYNKQRNMAAKIAFLTPLQGYTNLGFEYSRKPLQSIEGSLGIIGLGSDVFAYNNPRGVSASAGYRFYAGPDFALRKLRNAHRMGGIYMQPSIGLSYMTSEITTQGYNPTNWTYHTVRADVQRFQGAFLLKLGRQTVFGDRISLDYNVGIGYGGSSQTISYKQNTEGLDYSDYLYYSNDMGYGFSVLDRTGLAVSSTLKLGFLFK